ncbi:MAG: zinc-ribbon domain-containing protein [Planctomycetia bacterium]|nr:zinc-ribbon domain-containing protein [Planctomycetia bacterium]
MSNADQFDSYEQTSRCPNCGAEISSNSPVCNHCGSPIAPQGSFGVPPQNNWGNQTPYNYTDFENPYASPQIETSITLHPLAMENREEMSGKIQRSWLFYSYCWLPALFLFLVAFGINIVAENCPEVEMPDFVLEYIPTFASLLAVILAFSAFINGLILLYRLWVIVPSSMASTTPGHAVGFLFIPIFNIYWQFVAYHQLAQHYRDLTRVAGSERGREGLAIARVIVQLIPNLNLFLPPILNYFLLSRLKTDAVYILEHYPDVSQVDGAQNPMGLPPYANSNTEYSLLVPVHTSGLAIAAGYLGLFSVLVIPAPFAILLGWLALRDLDKHPGLHGYGRAWFAIVAGSLVLLGIATFISVAICMG